MRRAALAAQGGAELMKARAAPAMSKRQKAELYAQQLALGDYVARVWHEGQHALRTVPGLREERCATHSWPVMTEEEAIAFGLDRRDRTRAWHMLRLLPRQLQWAVVEAGLLDAMPESVRGGQGQMARAYSAVSRAAGGALCMVCTRCGKGGGDLPATCKELESATCPTCGREQVCRPSCADSGASEAYTVWLQQCAAGRLGPRPEAADLAESATLAQAAEEGELDGLDGEDMLAMFGGEDGATLAELGIDEDALLEFPAFGEPASSQESAEAF